MGEELGVFWLEGPLDVTLQVHTIHKGGLHQRGTATIHCYIIFSLFNSRACLQLRFTKLSLTKAPQPQVVKMFKLFIVSFALVLTIAIADDGIKCYSCAPCDAVNENTKITSGHKSCVKTSAAVKDMVVITRMGTNDDKDSCNTINSDIPGTGAETCHCMTDLCNGAYSNTVLTALIGFMLFVPNFL